MTDKYTGKKMVDPLDLNPVIISLEKCLSEALKLKPAISDKGKVLLSQEQIDKQLFEIREAIALLSMD